MTITLPPALDRLVRDKVASGFYASESEVIAETLRHYFGRDSEEKWIREHAAAGFAQLEAGKYDDLSREEIQSRLTTRRAA